MSGSEMKNFHMIDVGDKAVTRRRAVARGRLTMAEATLTRLKNKSLPKGDALVVAEVAGIQAAKKTSETLPLCHPLALDYVRIQHHFDDATSVSLVCEAVTHAKTGVEMEALVGVQAALACVYDLTKGVDPVLAISDIHLCLKEGGKHGLWKHPQCRHALEIQSQDDAAPRRLPFAGLKACVLTISDRCFAKSAEDVSGRTLKSWLENGGASVMNADIVPDDVAAIREKVLFYCRDVNADIVLTTGGTGLSPRDKTPDALTPLMTMSIPGIGELLRHHGAQHTSMSWISRQQAGMIGLTLAILLPGSDRAVREGLAALEDLIPHALHIVRGGKHG